MEMNYKQEFQNHLYNYNDDPINWNEKARTWLQSYRL